MNGCAHRDVVDRRVREQIPIEPCSTIALKWVLCFWSQWNVRRLWFGTTHEARHRSWGLSEFRRAKSELSEKQLVNLGLLFCDASLAILDSFRKVSSAPELKAHKICDTPRTNHRRGTSISQQTSVSQSSNGSSEASVFFGFEASQDKMISFLKSNSLCAVSLQIGSCISVCNISMHLWWKVPVVFTIPTGWSLLPQIALLKPHPSAWLLR